MISSNICLPFPYTSDVVVDDENGQEDTGLSEAGRM